MIATLTKTAQQPVTLPVLSAISRVAVTGALAVAAVAIFACDVATLFEFSRTALESGQWWRIFTGHLTHWSGDHLAWDLFMFVVLGAMLERRSRSAFVALLAGSAFAISAAIYVFQPEIAWYRGLSGVDSGLFVAVCMGLLTDAWRHRDKLIGNLAIAALISFAFKTVFEFATGTTWFVDCAEAGFVPLALSHLAGAMVGLVPSDFLHSRSNTLISERGL